MPTYEYACRDCGEHIEVVQSFRDEPLSVCPACGGALRKVFSPVGVVLKGSGFYRNDSRPAPKSESGGDMAGSAKGDRAGSAKGDRAGSAKAESKTEGKKEAKKEQSSSGKTETKSA